MIISKIKIAILAPVLLLVVIGGYLWQTGSLAPKPASPPGPPEKITISTLPIFTPGLLFVAQEKGYFRDNGLEVTIKIFQTGPMGIEQLQAGQIDIAYVADFVLVGEIFKGHKSLRCLGSIAAADIVDLMALKDRGIRQPGDLEGKRIGVARGTIAEFFLGRFLTFNHLTLKDVEISYLRPDEMAEALAKGLVDAVMVWDPVTYDIIKQLGGRIINWPGQSNQKFYNVLVSTDKFIQSNSSALEKLFRALSQAEIFIKNNRDESLDIIAKQISLDKSVFKADWLNSDYELSFDQSLLIAMEDEARWIIKNKLTEHTRLPNFLNYCCVEPLAKVNPKAVKVIIPKDEGGIAPAPAGKRQEHR